MDEVLNENTSSKNTFIQKWDKYLLLFFIVSLILFLILLNRQSNDFFPDARLYPFYMTILGILLSIVSIIRVVLGKEPNVDMNAEKEWNLSSENIVRNYTLTTRYLLMFVGFYLGVWLFGFYVSSAIFVFSFIKLYGKHTLLICTLFTVFGLLLVKAISWILDLVMPTGLILEQISRLL